jgi:hypothetical protein
VVGLATQVSAASGEVPRDSCQGRDRLTHSHDLPRAVPETRLAPGDGNQVRTVTRGSPHVLAVAEPLPCLRRLQGSPVAEIRIIAFVRASWEVRHTSGRDEQQPVLAAVAACCSARPCGQDSRLMSQNSQ